MDWPVLGLSEHLNSDFMNRTNELIKWVVIIGDFLLLNLLLFTLPVVFPHLEIINNESRVAFYLICNLSLLLSEYRFHTVIHQRLVSAGDILRRIVLLVLVQSLVAYVIAKISGVQVPAGYVGFQGIFLFSLLLFARYFERTLIKCFRQRGRNTRTMTFVGTNKQLNLLYEHLVNDPTTGYRLQGYYSDDAATPDWRIDKSGTLTDLMNSIERSTSLHLGDELYVCLPREYSEIIHKLSRLCDKFGKRFFYVPPYDDLLKISLREIRVDDISIFTTHESPLRSLDNMFVKRLFDILFSIPISLAVIFIYPILAVIIKYQSPGPVLFKQVRTGMDGKDFVCYKFRSMHINKDADKIQATQTDRRKFPFGAFMRRTSIDELPQFWNVLRGDMSVVGPRPHMLAHTKMYQDLIEQYMVRHLVKPGITGWAQVTGYRGETKELWQMKGRIERDLWYIENWSFWLDARIIWMTFKSILSHNDMAY